MMKRLLDIAAERKDQIEKAAFLNPAVTAAKGLGSKALKVLGAAGTGYEVTDAFKRGAGKGIGGKFRKFGPNATM